MCASSWTITKNHCMMHGQQNANWACCHIRVLSVVSTLHKSEV